MPLRLKQKKSKYRSVRVDVNGQPVPKGYKGETFDSKAEHKRWCELKLLERAGKISDLQLQVRIDILALPGNLQYLVEPAKGRDIVKLCTWVADFSYVLRGVGLVYEDVKSPASMTPVYRLKKKMLKLLMGIDILETGIIRKKRRR